MAKEAPELFVTEHETRMEQTFQREGSDLLRTCRSKDPSNKSQVKIYVAGSGEAKQRPSRGADIPYMNAGRTSVLLDIEASFAGDPVDWEDLESMEIDDIQAIADTSALAIGRKIDDVIISELDTGAANHVGDYSATMSPDLALQAKQKALSLHWPKRRGSWYCLLDSTSWNHMLTYDVFNNADYTGDTPFANPSYVRDWDGIIWMHNEALLVPATDQVTNLMYYGPAVAAAGAVAPTAFDWLGGQQQQWSVMAKARHGAKLSQAAAAIQIRCSTAGGYGGTSGKMQHPTS